MVKRMVGRKEGWLPLADGMKALEEANKGFRTLDSEDVKSATAWEVRQQLRIPSDEGRDRGRGQVVLPAQPEELVDRATVRPHPRNDRGPQRRGQEEVGTPANNTPMLLTNSGSTPAAALQGTTTLSRRKWCNGVVFLTTGSGDRRAGETRERKVALWESDSENGRTFEAVRIKEEVRHWKEGSLSKADAVGDRSLGRWRMRPGHPLTCASSDRRRLMCVWCVMHGSDFGFDIDLGVWALHGSDVGCGWVTKCLMHGEADGLRREVGPDSEHNVSGRIRKSSKSGTGVLYRATRFCDSDCDQLGIDGDGPGLHGRDGAEGGAPHTGACAGRLGGDRQNREEGTGCGRRPAMLCVIRCESGGAT